MLKPAERWLFLIAFLCLVSFEAYQGFILAQAKFDLWNSIWILAMGILLVGPGKIFLKIISKLLLDLGVTTTRLHEFSSERSRLMGEMQKSNTDEYVAKAGLVTNTLKFSESWLNGWVKGSHFELSVFVDSEMPLLFAYFDSRKDAISRSAKARKANPNYYRESEYEVTRCFENPSSSPYIVSDTKNSRYVFMSRNQKGQIGSTILLFANVDVPCVLVVTSDKKNAFSSKNKELILFVQFIAETVYSDIIQDDFVHRIRALRPELFTPPPKHSSPSY